MRVLFAALVVAVAAHGVSGQVDLGTGLIAHWDFEGGLSPISDLAGGHVGVLSGGAQFTATELPPVFGGARALDVPGAGKMTVTPGPEFDFNFESDQAMSIAAWFKRQAGLHVFGKRMDCGAPGASLHYQLATLSTTGCFETCQASPDCSGVHFNVCSLQLPLGAWTHFAVTFDGVLLRGWINGNLVNETPFAFVPGNDAPFVFGNSGTCGNGFDGYADDLRFYDRALREEEVRALAGKGSWIDKGCALSGVAGAPVLVGFGVLSAGSSNGVDLSDAAPDSTAGLFIATAGSAAPFKGGVLKPVSPVIAPLILTTDANGEVSIPFVMPVGIPALTEIWLQYAIQDAAAIHGVALSNAVLGVTP